MLRLGPRRRLFERSTVAKVLALLFITVLVLAQTHHRPPVHHISTDSQATDLAVAIAENERLSAKDASQPQYAGALCREHGWERFKRRAVPHPGTGSSKRKVYDLFTLNTELDWLEIRLNTTYDYVDYFVIVEGQRTFTNMEKPLVLRDNWARFAPWHDKIIYHELTYPEDVEPTLSWDFETLQRNALFTQVFPSLKGEQAPTEGDVLVVADVDEIVRPETLLVLRACDIPRRLTLRSRMYYYSFSLLHRGEEWAHPQATTYQGSLGQATILPDDLRNGIGGGWGYLLGPLARWREQADLWNAGWHCSSCFSTLNEVLRKMESSSHMQLNAPEYRKPERIVDQIRTGKDLWDREGQIFDFVPGNEDIPAALSGNRERWQYLLDRNGSSAGFTDYAS